MPTRMQIAAVATFVSVLVAVIVFGPADAPPLQPSTTGTSSAVPPLAVTGAVDTGPVEAGTTNAPSSAARRCKEVRDAKFPGRDHHAKAFPIWLAGAGIRRGVTIGATDEPGSHVPEAPVHVNDLHATMLQLLGIDHERLSSASRAASAGSPTSAARSCSSCWRERSPGAAALRARTS